MLVASWETSLTKKLVSLDYNRDSFFLMNNVLNMKEWQVMKEFMKLEEWDTLLLWKSLAETLFSLVDKFVLIFIKQKVKDVYQMTS